MKQKDKIGTGRTLGATAIAAIWLAGAAVGLAADTPAAPAKPAEKQPLAGTLVTIDGKDPRIVTQDGVREGKWCGMMWCPFAGTSVKLIGSTGPAGGMAEIYVDGIHQKTADWYSDQDASHATLFAAENLPDGKHVLGVLTRGTKRAESKGTSINWSRIEFIAGAHPERFVPVRRTRFDPNVPLWLDNQGEILQCHMGGIMYYQGKCLHVEKAEVLGTGGEAPAIFKHDGIYYLLHSHLTGLGVNENFYHTATNIWGPWQAMGKIAQGEHSLNTFMTQTTDVVPVAGKKGVFLWIGDSIRNNAPPYARTVWLPVTLKGKGEMEIRWRDSWDLSVFDEVR